MPELDAPYDIFLSYAASDNNLPDPLRHWVTRFEDALRATLRSLRGGKEPRIYFDKLTIEPNHQLEEILDECRRATLFVAIVSPAYHLRPWTRKEIEAFSSTHPDPRQLFAIELLPSSTVEGLEVLKERHFMRMYRAPTSPGARAPVPITPGDDMMFEYVMDLAMSIQDQLKRVAEAAHHAPLPAPSNAPAAPNPAAAGKPVLLAQVTDDLEDERLKVRRFLEQYGCQVICADDYPQSAAEFQASFQADLKRCSLVVQLLSSLSGRKPADMPQGFVKAQAEWAAQAEGVKLMQWRPFNLDIHAAHPSQQELLTGATVTASTLDVFNKEVLGWLQQPPRPDQAPGGEEAFKVFINSEEGDRSAANLVYAKLRDEYEVALPPEKPSGSVQERFKELLCQCHALLLFCGSEETASWVIDQLMHASKVRRGMKPLKGAICYGPGTSTVGYSLPALTDMTCHDGKQWMVDNIVSSVNSWRSAHTQDS